MSSGAYATVEDKKVHPAIGVLKSTEAKFAYSYMSIVR
jgi:hypothetical protein